MIREPVARRYAHALFDAAWAEGEAQAPAAAVPEAREKAALRHVVELGANLEAVDRFLDDPANRKWRDLLLAPQIAREERERVIERLFAERTHSLVLRLLHLMLRKKRIQSLAMVWEAYRLLLDEARGVIHAEVTTAVPLPDDLKQQIARALLKHLRRQSARGPDASARRITEVELETLIDPSLLGGVRVRIGDRVIERSVRRDLERMAEALYEAPILD